MGWILQYNYLTSLLAKYVHCNCLTASIENKTKQYPFLSRLTDIPVNLYLTKFTRNRIRGLFTVLHYPKKNIFQNSCKISVKVMYY